MNRLSNGHRNWSRGFLAALAVVVVAYFVRLDIDPPYGIITIGGELFTDEGWYTKAAQLHAKYGVWTNQCDMVWFSHNSLFSLVQTLAYELFGVGVIVARCVSAAAFCVTLAAFYGVLRTVQPRAVALGTCLVAAVTLQTFAHARLALVEPAGTAVSMLALLAWVRLPRGIAACTAGLLLAAAAYFVKASFIFTFTALFILAAGEAIRLAFERRWRHAALVLAVTAAVPFAARHVQGLVSSVVPEQAAEFALWHVESRVNEMFGGDILFNEAKSLYKVTFATGGAALVAVMAFGIPLLLVRSRGSPRLPWPRAAVAIVLWGLGGTSFFGLFYDQPPRYFYFAIFPLAFGAVTVACRLVPEGRRAFAVLGVLALHAAVQVPGFAAWLGRADLLTADRAYRDVVARMDLRGAPPEGVSVIGGTVGFLALHDPRIRPLDYRWQDDLRERVERWRPRYLFTTPTKWYRLAEHCPGLVERVEPLASYRILDNYCTLEDHVLYRIVYAR